MAAQALPLRLASEAIQTTGTGQESHTPLPSKDDTGVVYYTQMSSEQEKLSAPSTETI
jgi:hypothetical protein